jgi:hypothetical protein
MIEHGSVFDFERILIFDFFDWKLEGTFVLLAVFEKTHEKRKEDIKEGKNRMKTLLPT